MDGNMSIICITTIIALSSIGVGYAAWNNGLNTDMAITTGNIQRVFSKFEVSDKDLDEGEWLSFTLSDDKQILYIDGEVFPSFNSSIPIKIIDEGSIPSKLQKIESIYDTDIIELKEKTKKKYSRSKFTMEDVVEPINLSINPDNDKEKDKNSDNRKMQKYLLKDQDEISNLQEQIDQYNTEKNYNFEYELLIEQDI